jgi:hypothetical protein
MVSSPAAPHRNHHRLRVGNLLDELEPDRPLSRDHDGVLEGVDERRARLVDVRLRGGEGVLEALAAHDQLGAVGAAGLDLRHRRVLRHVDAGGNPRLPRGPGNGLAVVAGACRDHADGALVVVEQRDPVDGAADLEGAGPLEVLRLQPDVPPCDPRERLRAVDGRLARDSRDALTRLLDVSERRAGRRLQL